MNVTVLYLEDCEEQCNVFEDCSHITFYEDNGCRIYSSCDLTENKISATDVGTDIYKRTNASVAASTSPPKYEEVCFYNEEKRPIADSSAGCRFGKGAGLGAGSSVCNVCPSGTAVRNRGSFCFLSSRTNWSSWTS